MTTPQKTIIDCVTGETIIKDFDAAELAQLKLDEAQAIKNAETKAQAEQDSADKRQTILDRLGITANELQTLLG